MSGDLDYITFTLPNDLFQGVDMFDCVWPTRTARFGLTFSRMIRDDLTEHLKNRVFIYHNSKHVLTKVVFYITF